MRPTEGPRAARTLAERAASAAVDEAERVLREGGAEPGNIWITLDAENVPAGELNATNTGYGFEDETELLAFLCARAQSMAEELGIPLRMTLDGRRFGS